MRTTSKVHSQSAASTRDSCKPLMSTNTSEKAEHRQTTLGHGKTRRCKANKIQRDYSFCIPIEQGSSFPTDESRLRGKVLWLFELDKKLSGSFPWAFDQMGVRGRHESTMHWAQPIDQVYYQRAVPHTFRLEADDKRERLGHLNVSGGEGDISEFGSDQDFNGPPAELAKEVSSLSSYEGPHVTRAPSDSSSSSESSDQRLNRIEKEGWEAKHWRFQAEMLMAERNLLWIEKELATRRWKGDCAESDRAVRIAQALRSAFHCVQEKCRNWDGLGGKLQDCPENVPKDFDRPLEIFQEDLKSPEVTLYVNDSFAREALSRLEKLQNLSRRHTQTMCETGNPPDDSENEPWDLHRQLEKLQEDLKRSEVAFYTNNSFAREALKRLEQLQSISGRRSEVSHYPEDPAEALQGKLENLLLAVQSVSSFARKGQESKATGGKPEALVIGNTESFLGNRAINTTGCIFQAAALRRQLDCLSSELTETKHIAGLIRREYRSLLSGNRRRRKSSSQKHSRLMQESVVEVQCKAAIRQIAAQVQAETEQWSRMQDILHHVKEEIEELHQARDLWEERALHAEAQLISLQEAVHEWRGRARAAEEQIAILQSEANKLRNKVERVKFKHALEQSRWLDAESQLKDAPPLTVMAKNSSNSQLQPQSGQKLDNLVKGDNQRDGNKQFEDSQDGNGNMSTYDNLKTSGCNGICNFRQQHYSSPGGSGIGLCQLQKLSTSSELKTCAQNTTIVTSKQKIRQVLKENRAFQKTSKTEYGQLKFDPLVQEQCVHGICNLKSSQLHSAQKLPFGEIGNFDSSPVI